MILFVIRVVMILSKNEDFIKLPKIGKLNWIKHREMSGKLKTVTIKRSYEKWYVFIVTDALNTKNYGENDKIVAIDVGIKTFATLSDNSNIENPRFLKLNRGK